MVQIWGDAPLRSRGGQEALEQDRNVMGIEHRRGEQDLLSPYCVGWERLPLPS